MILLQYYLEDMILNYKTQYIESYRRDNQPRSSIYRENKLSWGENHQLFTQHPLTAFWSQVYTTGPNKNNSRSVFFSHTEANPQIYPQHIFKRTSKPKHFEFASILQERM